jgi:hypothetical protein
MDYVSGEYIDNILKIPYQYVMQKLEGLEGLLIDCIQEVN